MNDNTDNTIFISLEPDKNKQMILMYFGKIQVKKNQRK